MKPPTFEKELGRIKWGKNRELVVRYVEFSDRKEKRSGVDIRFYMNNREPDGYAGWTKEGIWIGGTVLKNFAAMLQKGLEIYEAQQSVDKNGSARQDAEKS